MVYIDLNMVRAGVVSHPSEYEFCGYNEMQKSKQRYALIDCGELAGLLGFKSMASLSSKYKAWIDEAIKINDISRQGRWSESIAVGSESFIKETRDQLGIKVIGRKVHEKDGTFELRESISPFNGNFGHENVGLKSNNRFSWSDFE